MQPLSADLLTVSEAARQADVFRSIVASSILHGWLPAVLIEGIRHVRPDDLAATQARVHLGNVVPAWRQHPEHAGKRLRVLREAAGWSQLQLAATSGLTHEAISRLELGRLSASAESVRKLAQALDVDPEQFVSHEPLGLRTLTVAEAASWLEVPAGRVRRWLKEGLLAGEKVSGQWRVLAIVVAELDRSERLRGRSRRLDPRYRG